MPDHSYRCSCGTKLRKQDLPVRQCRDCGRSWRVEPKLTLVPVECPWCGWQGDVFATHSAGIRNYRCPQCHCRPWHRLLHFYLQMETDFLFNPSSTVLHFAPETSLRQWFQSLPNVQQYVTTDLEHRGVDVIADICHLPFPENTFDLIVNNHVMEHIPDDRAAMRELFRVLKPGGTAVFTFPYRSKQPTYEDATITTNEGRNEHFGQGNHVRLIGNDYAERFRSVGFNAAAIPYRNELPAELVTRHALIGSVYLFRCDKPLLTDPA